MFGITNYRAFQLCSPPQVMLRYKGNASGNLPEITISFLNLHVPLKKIIFTGLLIQHFKSFISDLYSLNKGLGLALLCPKTPHSQQLSSTESLIEVPQELITTLTSLLGVLFSASALPSPSSHFAFLVWGSSSQHSLRIALECGKVLFLSGALGKLKRHSKITSFSGGLPLRLRDLSSFHHDWLPMAGLHTELKIPVLLQLMFSCDQEMQTQFQVDFTFSGLVHLI